MFMVSEIICNRNCKIINKLIKNKKRKVQKKLHFKSQTQRLNLLLLSKAKELAFNFSRICMYSLIKSILTKKILLFI